MNAASEALQQLWLWVHLPSENTLVSPWFHLKDTNRAHRTDGRGFGDLLHGYQQLQDVLKSPNAAKTLVMDRASERVGLAAHLCQQRMPVEPTAPPAHGESQPAATGWVPGSDKNFSCPSFPLSALLHSSNLGGMQENSFPHGAAFLEGGEAQSPCLSCTPGGSSCGTAKCFLPAPSVSLQH